MVTSQNFESFIIIGYAQKALHLTTNILSLSPDISININNNDFFWNLHCSQVNSATFASGDETIFHGVESRKSSLVIEGRRELFELKNFKKLSNFLNFITKFLPKTAIIFCTTDPSKISEICTCDSIELSDYPRMVGYIDKIFFEFAEKNKNAFVFPLESLGLWGGWAANLFEFLGVKVDESKLAAFSDPEPGSDLIFGKFNSPLDVSGRKEDKKMYWENDSPCKPDATWCDRKPPGAIVLFSVVKDEILRLPWFFEYYRSIGCRDFVIIDNGSKDGTVEFLRAQNDVFLYHAPSDKFASSRGGKTWINALVKRHALFRWVLVADIDEILVWSSHSQEDLNVLIYNAQRLGLNRVFTPMLDIYPPAPCSDMRDYVRGHPFFNYAWLMDDVKYTKVLSDGVRLLVYSGPRARFTVRGRRPPLMTKQKLYYSAPGGYENIGSHFDTYGLPSPLIAPFLHFKYLSDFDQRADKAIFEGQYWNNSSRYREYKLHKLGCRSLQFEGSVDFRNDDGVKKYTDVLSRAIRQRDVFGSTHWKKHFLITNKDTGAHHQI